MIIEYFASASLTDKNLIALLKSAIFRLLAESNSSNPFGFVFSKFGESLISCIAFDEVWTKVEDTIIEYKPQDYFQGSERDIIQRFVEDLKAKFKGNHAKVYFIGVEDNGQINLMLADRAKSDRLGKIEKALKDELKVNSLYLYPIIKGRKASHVTWTISDTTIAATSLGGLVTAVAAGTTHVTASQSGVVSSAIALSTMGKPTYSENPAIGSNGIWPNSILNAVSVSLNDDINPNGADTVVTFAYTSEVPGSPTIKTAPQDIGAGYAPVYFSVLVTDLTPGMTYDETVVAVNIVGNLNQVLRDSSFTTLKAYTIANTVLTFTDATIQAGGVIDLTTIITVTNNTDQTKSCLIQDEPEGCNSF